MANEMVIGGLTITVTRPVAKAGTGVATLTGGIDAGNGCTLTPSYEVYSPDIEQELFASLFRYMKKAFKMAWTYAEPVLANMQNAWDISNTITAGVLNFGTAAAVDFIPADLVVSITSFSPGAATASSLRTISFTKVNVESPGEYKITKKQISTVPVTANALYDTAVSRTGRFTDILT